ncbi:FG-GAP repeat domain-containing protein [Methylobacterium flocculans]|uniref:FG-GAP repeat domain-containing protein n=1 Tax=Methylobacterium flocculans TaxID=2984843 RepID=UPI0021F3AD68|nr:VCBS repeat-containing protein [Methylobacterium sp. FF17]
MAFSFGTRRSFATASFPNDLKLADLNGDGRLDAVTANSGNIGVSVLLGRGDGSFDPVTNYSTAGSDAYDVDIADLNGDGNLDLVVGLLYGRGVGVLYGNGAGQFGPTQVISAGAAGAVAAADLDSDGDVDLVATDQDRIGATVFLNGGSGSFGARQDYTGISLGQVVLADLNGDGTPDLIVTSADGVNLSWLPGAGDGRFGAREFIRTDTQEGTSGPSEAAVLDVNGDGRADIVAVNNIANSDGIFTASVILGLGDGSFGSAQGYVTGEWPTDVSVVDVDGDSRADILTADFFSGKTSLLSGNGDGTFQPRRDFEVGRFAIAVDVGDLNGDGKSDLVSADYGAASVSVLLGRDEPRPFVFHTQYGPNDGTLKAGESVLLTVTLSEPVTIQNGAGLNLHMSAGGVAVFESSLSDSSHLVFRYTVPPGQGEADLRINAYEFNGAFVADAQGNELDLHNVVSNPDGILRVVTAPPVVRTVTYDANDGILRAGDAVDLAVGVSDPVIVTPGADPFVLNLNDGGVATYVTALSDPTHLVFRHVVQPGYQAADLAVTAFEFNGATVQELAGNELDFSRVLTNPVGTLHVDGVSPTVNSVTFSFAETPVDPVRAGIAVLALDEAVSVMESSDFILDLNFETQAHYDRALSDSTHLAFRYTVPLGATPTDLAVVAIAYNGAVVVDGSGNAADLSLAIQLSGGLLE